MLLHLRDVAEVVVGQVQQQARSPGWRPCPAGSASETGCRRGDPASCCEPCTLTSGREHQVTGQVVVVDQQDAVLLRLLLVMGLGVGLGVLAHQEQHPVEGHVGAVLLAAGVEEETDVRRRAALDLRRRALRGAGCRRRVTPAARTSRRARLDRGAVVRHAEHRSGAEAGDGAAGQHRRDEGRAAARVVARPPGPTRAPRLSLETTAGRPCRHGRDILPSTLRHPEKPQVPGGAAATRDDGQR